jgi:hypothetical protein
MYAQCMKEKVLGGELYKSDKISQKNSVLRPGFY